MKSKPNKIPPGCQQVLDMMAEGYRLYSGPFGFWLKEEPGGPLWSRNVNHHTGRALVRRKLIRWSMIRGTEKEGACFIEWVRNPPVFEDEYQSLLNEQPPLPALEPNPALPDLKPVGDPVMAANRAKIMAMFDLPPPIHDIES